MANVLPILDELFSSDTVILLLLGVATALFLGLVLRTRRSRGIGLAVSLAVYLLCELGCHFVTGYLWGFLLLFLGTVALGGVISFLIGVFLARR